MENNLFFVMIFVCLFSYSHSMEETVTPQKTVKSNKHLLIRKSLSDYLINEIADRAGEENAQELENIFQSDRIPTCLKERLLSTISIKQAHLTIKFLAKLWQADNKDHVIDFFKLLNFEAKKTILNNLIKLVSYDKKAFPIYFDCPNSLDINITEFQKLELESLGALLKEIISGNTENLLLYDALINSIIRGIEQFRSNVDIYSALPIPYLF